VDAAAVSMLRPILRACAVGALRDQTWAEERVYDSDLTPLAQAVYGGPAKPYVVVYSDQDDVVPVKSVAEMYDGETRSLSLAVEIGIAGAVRSTPNDPLSPLTIKFAATDMGMEWACDVMSAQVVAALFGQPKSQWGELFKRMIVTVRRMPTRRGGQASSGVRFAARRMIFVLQPMYDFSPGIVPVPVHPVWDFIALARASPAIGQVDIATIVEDLMVKTAAPDWRAIQGQLGLTQAGIEAINAAVPLPWPEMEEPPLDYSDAANEFVPPLTDITLADMDASTSTAPKANPPSQELGGP
jgi:hypothetical protein